MFTVWLLKEELSNPWSKLINPPDSTLRDVSGSFQLQNALCVESTLSTFDKRRMNMTFSERAGPGSHISRVYVMGVEL